MNRVLIIDDDQSLLTILEVLFSRDGFEVMTAPGGREALERLRSGYLPDLVITDIGMPGVDGIQVLREAKKADLFLPVVVITGQTEKKWAIDACNEGAYYFLEKPFENRKLLAICREALEFAQADRRYSVRRRELTGALHPDQPVGQAPAFLKAMELARRAAASESTILIQGESGTGKELVARFIYQSSARANRPFITVNCGALPETLLESELFGHVKGSFTGAISSKDGLFKVASGGTIFLDEVGDTSLAFQVKLLRVLQEREITPVGSTEPVAVDVRVIAATNKDLESEVETGQFRRDLFYRLNVIPITVPPLRERCGDIPLLIDHFLKRLGRGQNHGELFTSGALEILTAYGWKGNIRELENVVEQLTVTGPSSRIGDEDLPARIRNPQPAPLTAGGPKSTPTLEAIETAYIEWVMNQVGGSRKEAARVLGIDPSTLYRKLTR